MKLREWGVGQLIIAASYTLALYIQFQHLSIFNTTLQTAIFFLPAAVRVFSVIVFEVLTMCIIQAVINSTAGHVFFALSPTVQQQFDPYYYAVMLIGDITGAFFVFILANLIFSLLLRLGLVSRNHYENN